MTGVLASALATGLAAALVLVQPWVGRRRYRKLVASVTGNPAARTRHYRRGILGEWSLSALVVAIGLLAGRGPAAIDLTAGAHRAAALGLVSEAAVVLCVSALVFRFGGAGVRQALRRQARGFQALLPRGRNERLAFAALAVTAGICEELIFRGFGIAYLRWLWPASPEWSVIVITSAGFGLVHLYQGLRGVVLTGVAGAFLAWSVFATGSLLPAMAIHALLDLRILALPDLQPSGVPPAATPAGETAAAAPRPPLFPAGYKGRW